MVARIAAGPSARYLLQLGEGVGEIAKGYSMSSDERPPSNPAGRRGARRPARTIDLKADEVASSPVADSPSETQDTPQQPAEPAPAAQVIVEEPSTQSIEPVSASPVYSEPPTSETDASGANPPPPPADPSLNDRDSSSGERPLLGLVRLIGAGAVGAALALLAFSLWWGTSNRGGDTSALNSRLSQVEQRLADMAARPSASGVDPKTVDDLASRVARVEGTVTTPPTAAPDSTLTNRLATLEGELRSLEEKNGVVARRSDEIASIAADARARAEAAAALPKAAPPGPPPAERSEVEALANRVATVERTAKAKEAE
jgi:hypothetical protein